MHTVAIGDEEDGKMRDVTELERRITAALERIARSIGQSHLALATQGTGAGLHDPELISDALEEERMANAQLQERLRTFHEREQTVAKQHQDEIVALKATHATESRDLVVMLDQMTKELTALRAERSAEAEEITDIIAALNPLIEEARHA